MAFASLLHHIWNHAVDCAEQLTWWQTIVSFIIFCIMCSWLPGNGEMRAPFVGYRWPFEPTFWVRMRFIFQSLGMMTEGYSKFKDSMFKITTNDADWLVLSQRYLDDLQSLPAERLSHTDALVTMWGSSHSPFALLNKSDLSSRALRDVVAPNYAKDLDSLVDELRYSLEHDIDIQDDWKPIDALELSSKLVLRISQRILIGWPMSRDQELLECAQGYADAATVVQFALKLLPRQIRPLVYPLLPQAWATKSWIRRCDKILAKEMQRRQVLEKSDPVYEKPKDLLQGMVDLEPSRPVDKLGHDFLVQALISRMAPVVTMAQTLVDLALHPEDIEELRDEVLQVIGPDGAGLGNLRQSFTKLDKMDSVLRESARFTPLSMMTMHRRVQDAKGITLHDGVHLPRGTHVAFPAYHIGRDPKLVSGADIYDGLRWYRKDLGEAQENEAPKHRFVTPDSNYLTFGSGKYVCPGRFIAEHMLKLMMTAVLLRYEFKWPPGVPVPEQQYRHVFAYPSKTTLLIKRRKDGDQIL
uniref:Cytochrome P450 monooxygenase ltmJ n=3 Tax=Clavicipitaceae TaxID=34397 RepID=LTMJ_EPIFI|nr:RecName: Full=Cytochrome P450 monooxygenase ltmJ; AltName: Full=Lolitrem B biosynthesis cluster 3 protein J [Epichloe festucae var. lolii]ABF20221.1 P450 monooxygenase [Epichloe festucae var. lolii]AFO85405.1 P450 monooxygenase [Epichloe festucae]